VSAVFAIGGAASPEVDLNSNNTAGQPNFQVNASGNTARGLLGAYGSASVSTFMGVSMASSVGLFSFAGTAPLVMGTTVASALIIGTNNTERVRILSTGEIVSTSTIYGSTSASGTLALASTTNATKGTVTIGGSSGFVYDETNKRLGVGISPSIAEVHLDKSQSAVTQYYASNASTGGSAQAGFRAGLSNSDPNTNYFSAAILGSSFSTIGVLTARSGFFEHNASAGAMIFSSYSGDMIFASGSTRTERARILNTGEIVSTSTIYGSQSASGSLTLGSTTNATKGAVTIASGSVFAFDPTLSASNLALQVSGDPDTGIARSSDGANSLAIYCGGSELVRLNIPAASSAIQFFGNLTMTTGKRITLSSGRLLEAQGANVGAAGTLTLGTDGNFFSITGNTNIDFITTTNWQAGSEITLQFTGTPTVNHNTGSPPGSTAAILLAGAANFAATANDTLTLVYNGTNWVEKARTVI
jgi:hypothetical protein